jgi:hypothetical protein
MELDLKSLEAKIHSGRLSLVLLNILHKGAVYLVAETLKNCGFVWKYIRIDIGSRPAVTQLCFLSRFTLFITLLFFPDHF